DAECHAVAASSSSGLCAEAVGPAVAGAAGREKVTAEDPHAGLPDPQDLSQGVPDLDLADASPDETPEAKIDVARRCEAAALESDPCITNSEGAEYYDRRARYVYATSHGFARGYATPTFG